MITLKNTIEVRRNVADVYHFLVDLENVPKWQPAVIQTKRLTEGPIRVGTQFQEVAKLMGRRVEGLCEITALVTNATLSFRGTPKGPFTYETTYTLTGAGQTTQVAIVGAFSFKGAWRLLEPLARIMLAMESGKELAAMAAAIERS